MAVRGLLHRKELNEFKEWLIKDGWKIEPDTFNILIGDYRILVARKEGKKYPLMVYDRHEGDHFSLLDRDVSVVRAFLKSRRELK